MDRVWARDLDPCLVFLPAPTCLSLYTFLNDPARPVHCRRSGAAGGAGVGAAAGAAGAGGAGGAGAATLEWNSVSL